MIFKKFPFTCLLHPTLIKKDDIYSIRNLVFFCLLLCIHTSINAQTFTWNGTISSDWGTATNWTPNGIPGAGSTVNINNNSVPFTCTLDADRTIGTLNINSNAIFDGAGNTLIVTGNSTINQSTLNNVHLQSARLIGFNTVVFNGNTTLTKNGTGNEDWTGGNTFNNVIINNNSSGRIRMAVTTGDSFLGIATFNKNNTGELSIARNGVNTFSGNITINSTAEGNLTFGQGGGTSTITSGAAILTSGFTDGDLVMNGITQNGTAANGSFQPESFSANNTILNGDISVTAATTITLNNSIFSATNVFTANNISGLNACSFSTASGNTIFTKNGPSNNDWTGGNTFGNVVINNNSGDRIRLAVSSGDTFSGTSVFNKNSTGDIGIARSGTNSFNGNITLNSITSGAITLGQPSGTCTIASGAALLTSGFTNGSLTLNGVTQNGTAANGNFQPQSFTADNTTLGGNISVITAGTITLNNSTFSATNVFTANSLTGFNSCSFSTASGNTIFTKNGTVNNDWTGGNTFGNVVINNNSTDRFRLANTNGDTFLGTLELNKNNTGEIGISRSGVNTFAGNITINSSTGGTVSIGQPTGTSTLASGAAILTNGFTAGSFVMNGITQSGTAANGTFQPQNFTAENSTLGGSISIIASNAITLNNSIFSATNVFTANSLTGFNACGFSTVSGNTTFTKNGTTDNTWTGGNTFGNVVFNNNSTGRLRLAGTSGDTFIGTAEFNKNNTGEIGIARNGSNTFDGNITINSTASGTLIFGQVGGTSAIASGAAILTGGFTDGELEMRGVTQSGTSANGTFQPQNFTAENTTLGGNIIVTAANEINLINSSFSGTNVFTANSFTGFSGCSFSAPSGSTIFNKNGAVDNTWSGGNTFGIVVINNNSTGRIRLAETTGDTFLATATFNKNSAGELAIARSGTNSFQGNIMINTASSGTLSFGQTGGLSSIDPGAAILTSGFTNCALVMNGITQNGSATNGSFQPLSFNATNSSLGGNISITADNTITLNNSSFNASNVFTANNFSGFEACSFSTSSGSTIFTKNGTGNDNWIGGNTFGNTEFINNTTSRIRFANTIGDIYSGNVTFIQNGTGQIQPAFDNDNFFRGNISTVGTASAITFGQGSGRVVFDGTLNQSILGEALLSPTFSRIRVNKPSNNVLLQVPIQVTINLDLIARHIISTETNLLTINDNATVTNASTLSFVDGPLRKVGNDVFTFPLGKNDTTYAPLSISAPANNAHHFTAEYFQGSPNAAGYDRTEVDPVLFTISSCEYWILNRTNGTSNVNVTLSWDARSCGVTDLSDLQVARWDGSLWQTHGNGGTTGTTISGTVVSAAPITNFSPFTLASLSKENPLPVELLYFNARLKNGSVELEWATSTEKDNDFFTIEKSRDGVHFEIVWTVSGAGNTNSKQNYSFVDTNPFEGISYYRLKQTDFDGKFEYFNLVAINNNDHDVGPLKIYPNPTSDIVKIHNPSNESYQVTIVDALGRIVYNEMNSKEISTNRLSNGIYTLRLISNDHEITTFTLLVEK